MLKKSPLAYTGNKFRQLPILKDLFPKNINIFFDVFAGGGDMININSKVHICNDTFANNIKILEEMYNNQSFYSEVLKIANEYNINKINKEAFLSFRAEHNTNWKNGLYNPIERFVLIKHSFNSQHRQNRKGEFNNPFAYNKIGIKYKALKEWLNFIQNKNLRFYTLDFRVFLKSVLKSKVDSNDFIYCDPPYTITNAHYNSGWATNDDLELFELLDRLDKRGIKWGMSNVLEHKGIVNRELKAFSERYKYNFLDFNYDKTMYHKHLTGKKQNTKEIYIYNY